MLEPIRIEQQEEPVSKAPRPPFVPLIALLARQYPDLADPAQLIADRRVLVDGRLVDNPRASVRRSAGIRVRPPSALRGQSKLAAGLDAFAVHVTGAVAVDVGAAAGGFTTELLERGARRVYAIDAGFGQLVGRLRCDPRVVNLERTNAASLSVALVPESVGVVTMDLSYLAVAGAVGFLGALRFEASAILVALVKPTFELRAGTLITDPVSVRAAIAEAVAAIESAGWRPESCTIPVVTGAGGAVESFVLARRTS